MPELTPEEKQRIYEEEKARLEARRIYEEEEAQIEAQIEAQKIHNVGVSIRQGCIIFIIAIIVGIIFLIRAGGVKPPSKPLPAERSLPQKTKKEIPKSKVSSTEEGEIERQEVTNSLEDREEREKQAKEYNLKAWAFVKANKQLDEAIDLAKKSIQLYPTADAYDTLGWAYYLKGQYNNAKKFVSKAYELKPVELHKKHLQAIEEALNKRK